MITAPAPNYTHNAKFLKIHDGDSFWLSVDFGRLTSGVTLEIPLYFRLAGIDCWELNDSEGRGVAARDFAHLVLDDALKIIIQTYKPETGRAQELEKYGRVLADVWVDGELLADLLRAGGHEKVRS